MICIDSTFVDMHQLVTTHTQDFLMDSIATKKNQAANVIFDGLSSIM
jgi:hypothetical protein